jgi:hypothetical protein
VLSRHCICDLGVHMKGLVITDSRAALRKLKYLMTSLLFVLYHKRKFGGMNKTRDLSSNVKSLQLTSG